MRSSPFFGMFGAWQEEGFCQRVACSGSHGRRSWSIRVGSDSEGPLSRGVWPLPCRWLNGCFRNQMCLNKRQKWNTGSCVQPEAEKLPLFLFYVWGNWGTGGVWIGNLLRISQLHGRSDSPSFLPRLPLIPLTDRGRRTLLAMDISNSQDFLKGFLACGNFL